MLSVGCRRTICTERGCLSNPETKKLSNAEAGAMALKMAFTVTTEFGSSKKFCVDDPIPVLEGGQAIDLVAKGFDACKDVFSKCFGNADALNNMFLRNGADTEVTDQDSGIDLDLLDKFYASLSVELSDLVLSCFARVASGLSKLSVATPFFRVKKGLRLFEIMLSFPQFAEPVNREVVANVFGALVVGTDNASRNVLAQWWSRSGKARLEHKLVLCHQVITMKIIMPPPVASLNDDNVIVSGAKAMGVIYNANELAGRLIRFSEFYNASLNDTLNLRDDFLAWFHKQGFSFCSTPYVLDTLRKSMVLRYESSVKQWRERARGIQMILQGMMTSPYLVFHVRRDHLIEDTLQMIENNEPEDLRKELKVKFDGEEGVDAGGVQKEFFQLIVREIFNPDFGMFVMDKETRTYWFNPVSEELREFELIGKVLGLAIYNSVILDVRFPHVVYKKLMGRATDLEDLKDVSPELYRGYKSLLEFDGNVEQVFARDFSVEVDHYGTKKVFELKPGGAGIPLTNENREEFVKLATDFHLNVSVAQQFAAFKKGFDMVTNGPAIVLFTPEELELLVCGEPVLDFEELERAAEYESDEFDASNQVVKWFWECVHDLSEEDKKRLLFFATGSDRAPIGGLRNLHLVIQKHGEGDDRLPSSHTCFNHLLLPAYTSKEALKAKLAIALDNCVGFGNL